jgi:hypothetical protein
VDSDIPTPLLVPFTLLILLLMLLLEVVVAAVVVVVEIVEGCVMKYDLILFFTP